MTPRKKTTNDIIINALYMIGELGTDEIPDHFMIATGMDILNELLDSFASDSIYIPFLTTLDSTFVTGKDTYSISDLVTADIAAPRIIDLSFATYQVPSGGVVSFPFPATQSFTASTATNLLTMNNTVNFPAGTPVVLSTNGTMPLPFVAGVTYYTLPVSTTEMYLCLSQANVSNGIYIPITTEGTGDMIMSTSVGAFPPVATALTYPLRIINKAQYYNVVRQNNLLSRPGFIFLNKQDQESYVTVYPAPDQPYPFSLKVKCMLSNVTANQELNQLPPNYYAFLKLAAARRFLSYYPSGNWNEQSEKDYENYYKKLKATNETDVTLRPSVILTAPEPFYWPNILSY